MTPEIPAAPTAPPVPAAGHADLRQRPAAELVRDLSTQASTLVHQELELARAELAAKGKQAGIGAGMLGGAGLLALYGTGAMVAAAILALSTALDGWLAAVIVGAALFVVAAVLALMGRARAKRAVPPAPQQTLASVKEDVRFTKEHVAEARHHHEEAR
jgi:Putative Actinobacterial Holin-X, holin superfamily III